MTGDQHPTLPIAGLITTRSKELGINRTELIRRSGYANISKGLRRLDQLLEGQFQNARGLIKAVSSALEVPADVVEQAVEDTKRQIADAEEAAWRAYFVPHAIILTERKVPQPIQVAAILGVDRLLRVDFETTDDPTTFVEQAKLGVREKLTRWKVGEVPCFGKPTGVVINYTPDHAVQFDLLGKSVMAHDHAYRPGKATFTIGRKPLTEAEMAVVFQSK